MSEIFIRIRYL